MSANEPPVRFCPECGAPTVDHGTYLDTAHEPGCAWMLDDDDDE